MEWILDNYEWLLSGIGVFALGLIIQLFKRRTTSTELTGSKTVNPINNQLKAKSLNFNQTIIQNSSTGNVDSNSGDHKPKSSDPELKRIKDQYFGVKNKLRTLIIKKLAEEHDKNFILQIRNITDVIEDECGIQQTETFQELERLGEQGLIQFDLLNNEIPTPYTRIELTEKYFESL